MAEHIRTGSVIFRATAKSVYSAAVGVALPVQTVVTPSVSVLLPNVRNRTDYRSHAARACQSCQQSERKTSLQRVDVNVVQSL